MKIYYWNTKKNFGDLVSPLLISRFTKLSSEWASPEEADMVMVGSILEHLPQGFRGVIAGSGKLHEHSTLHLANAQILALRGPLTAIGIKGDYVLGDLGLLADELVPLPEKKYDLGIVPHWTDKTLEHTPVFKQFKPKIIRVTDNPLDVIREIGECKKIVSSSLHGIITADAFNIPRRIEVAPRMISHTHQEGGLFKFLDYSASLGVKLEIGITQLIDPHVIADKQSELFDVMQQIKSIFK